ncbi:MAG: DUF4129 domain-containing protein [Actinomycetota bacterium]|nr:DUF4129 domain-containing protein [Actinomycetota bacterium]
MASCLVALILLLLVAALSRDAGDAATTAGSDLPSLAGVVTVIAVVGVVVMVITLVVTLRDGESQPGGRRLPRPPIFLVIALAMTMWLPTLFSILEEAPPDEADAPAEEVVVDEVEGPEGDDRLPASPVVLVVVTVLATGGLVLARLLRPHAPEEAVEAVEADDGGAGWGPATPGARRRLVAGLDAVIADLRRDPDPRRAVIRAWARLEDLLAEHELPRHPSEAPTHYVRRVLEHLAASRHAVQALTATFERAMFSSHVIGPGDQVAAVDALVAVRDDLGVRA